MTWKMFCKYYVVYGIDESYIKYSGEYQGSVAAAERTVDVAESILRANENAHVLVSDQRDHSQPFTATLSSSHCCLLLLLVVL